MNDAVQTGVDTRRYVRQSPRGRRSDAGSWTMDVYDSAKYVCTIDGEDYMFAQVLLKKAADAGSRGATNALYRLSSAQGMTVLLYGVKAFPLSRLRETGFFDVRLHAERGTDKVAGQEVKNA